MAAAEKRYFERLCGVPVQEDREEFLKWQKKKK